MINKYEIWFQPEAHFSPQRREGAKYWVAVPGRDGGNLGFLWFFMIVSVKVCIKLNLFLLLLCD